MNLLESPKDQLISYRGKIEGLKKAFSSVDPEKVTLITTPVSPYSISIVAGIPLFRTHEAQRDYNAVIHDIRKIIPNQFPYDNLRTHVAVGVLIRNSPGTTNGHGYVPKGNKNDFYAEYLAVFNRLSFKRFSLKLKSICENGLILWDPAENEEEIFNIRNQITDGLEERKSQNPSLYYETKDGRPNIHTGIVHSTFLRFANRDELVSRWSDYRKYIKLVNTKLKEGEIFREPITISELSFIEPRVSNPISTRDWYTDELIARRQAR